MYDLIGISNCNNGDPTAKAFHGKTRGAIGNAVCASELSMIIHERGAVQRYEHRERNANESE